MYNFIPDERHPENPLTLEMLKNMQPDTIFAHGYAEILHPWFNHIKQPKESGGDAWFDGDLKLEIPYSRYRLVKWVAIRGGIHDWAIYHSNDANINPNDHLDGTEHLDAPWETIARSGAKLRREEEIKSIIPCDDEAFKMYRY